MIYRESEHYDFDEQLDIYGYNFDTTFDTFQEFWNDDVIAISKSGPEITKIDAVNGKIEFELDNADTDIEPGKYEYEVLIIDVEANRYLPSKGVI